jgi:hypothetical protein
VIGSVQNEQGLGEIRDMLAVMDVSEDKAHTMPNE